MIAIDPRLLTHEQLRGAHPSERVALVEAYLIAAMQAINPKNRGMDGGARLADLAIDSLQIVTLKFGLDEIAGAEIDVDVIVSNPTVRELAEAGVRASGL